MKRLGWIALVALMGGVWGCSPQVSTVPETEVVPPAVGLSPEPASPFPSVPETASKASDAMTAPRGVSQAPLSSAPAYGSVKPSAIAAAKSKEAALLASAQAESATARANPFAAADHPRLEVRVTERRPATQPLPPIPQVVMPQAIPQVSWMAGQGSLTPLNPAPATWLAPGALLPQGDPALKSGETNPGGISVPNQPPAGQSAIPAMPSAVPAAVPVSPTAIAEKIQISGVVRLGNQVAIIVKEDDRAASRTVSAGDRLANGQVELRRIETPENQAPRVVLVQNGVEVIRSVGA